MHWPLNSLTGTRRAPLALAVACMAFTLTASEKVEITAPTGKPSASLTPIRPQDLENNFKIFGRSESKTSGGGGGVELPPTQSFRPDNGPVLDAKTRSRLLQEWDKKKNWLLNGSARQAELGQDKDSSKDEDPFEQISGHHRTVLEKHILGLDAEGKQAKEQESRRLKKQDDEADASGNADQAVDDEKLSGISTRSGLSKGGSDRENSDKEASRALFTDPFKREASDKQKNSDSSIFAQKAEKEDATETPAESSSRSAARMGQIFGQPAANSPGASAQSPITASTDAFGRQNSHRDDLHSILGRDPSAPSSVAGILGGFASSRPAVAAPAPLPAFSQPVFVPAPQPRRQEPVMEAQPFILPKPTRDF